MLQDTGTSAATPGRESLHRKGVAPPPLVCLWSQPGTEQLLSSAVLCLTDCISNHAQRRAGFVVGWLRRADNIHTPSPVKAEPRGAGPSFCPCQIHTAPSWVSRAAGCSPSVPEKPPSWWRWGPAQQERPSWWASWAEARTSASMMQVSFCRSVVIAFWCYSLDPHGWENSREGKERG